MLSDISARLCPLLCTIAPLLPLLYNEMVRSASPLLYDIYNGLYVRNLTQEGFSLELCCTPEYVQILNKRLLVFLQKEILKGGYSR